MKKSLYFIYLCALSLIHADPRIDRVYKQLCDTAYDDGFFSNKPKNQPEHYDVYVKLISELDEATLKQNPDLIMRKLLSSDEDSMHASKKFIKDLQFILQHADPQTNAFKWAKLHKSLTEDAARLYPELEKIAFHYMNILSQDPENSDELYKLMETEIMQIAKTFVDNRLRETFKLDFASTGRVLREEILEKCNASEEWKAEFLQWVLYLNCPDPDLIMGIRSIDNIDISINDVDELVILFTYYVPGTYTDTKKVLFTVIT